MSAHDERDRGVERILERAIAVQVRRRRRARGVHGPQELLALPIRFLSAVAYGDAQE